MKCSTEQDSDEVALVGSVGLLVDFLEMRPGGIVADSQMLCRMDEGFPLHQLRRQLRFGSRQSIYSGKKFSGSRRVFVRIADEDYDRRVSAAHPERTA